jgi:hypothetical protein
MLLRNKERERLVAIFSSASVPVEVLAYGSRVGGGAMKRRNHTGRVQKVRMCNFTQ